MGWAGFEWFEDLLGFHDSISKKEYQTKLGSAMVFEKPQPA